MTVVDLERKRQIWVYEDCDNWVLENIPGRNTQQRWLKVFEFYKTKKGKTYFMNALRDALGTREGVKLVRHALDGDTLD